MKITIHRGTHQIGGCVTEYECDGWRLFVDYGEQLPGSIMSDTPLDIEGLTKGDISRSVLLITHYHKDHIGRICDLPAELPIYMGQVARDICEYGAAHLRFVDELSSEIVARVQKAKTFIPGEAFSFGPFTVMPIVIDHSAFDAYAFRIEADDVKVFHTGDFRTHGFRSSKLPKVIEKFVGRVDYVVCEATNISRPEGANESEHDLQKRFEQSFRDNKYNIVYASSSNIDRLFALYHAALRAGRPFYVDGYQRHMMDIVAGRDTIWGKSKLYRYGEYEPITIQREGEEFRITPKFEEFLTEKGYVLIARANPRFDGLIAKMPGECKKFYLSMWKGYLNPESKAFNKSLASSLGSGFEYMHTSGHCDMTSLRGLIEMLKPKGIIPIHTDTPEAFSQLFSDISPVVILNDGESVTPISGKYFDACMGYVYFVKSPSDNVVEISNPTGAEWYSIDKRLVGYFSHYKDAIVMLRHTVFKPVHLLCYEVIEEEDSDYLMSWHYDRDFAPMHGFSFFGDSGHHKPDTVEFKAGEKVWAMITESYNVLVPCIVEKDTTVKNPMDRVAVRSLVRVASKLSKMNEKRKIPAVRLFPFREF